MTRGDGNELAGAQVHGGPSRGYISPPRAVLVASASSSHPQERARTTQSTPESFYARDRPELRRLVDLPQHYLPVHVLALGLRWWRAALGSHGAAGNGQPSAHAVAAGGARVRDMVVAI